MAFQKEVQIQMLDATSAGCFVTLEHRKTCKKVSAVCTSFIITCVLHFDSKKCEINSEIKRSLGKSITVNFKGLTLQQPSYSR